MLVFIALHNLALAYERVRKYDEAIKTYEESLELKRRCDDGNLVEMSTSTYMESCSSYYLPSGLSTLATRSRSDHDRIEIRPIHIARWIRSRSDRDRLNPIRNSERYFDVRYACSRNI